MSFITVNLTRRVKIRSIKGRGKDRGNKKGGYRVNKDIIAQEVRLIDDAGTMLGVYSPREALTMAEDKGLDLIEIAPNAKPPTCKIMDYGKWKYQNKKKAVEARKKQNIVSIKEIQVRPRTESHDLDVKVKSATRFLLSGDKVKVNLRFSGREIAHQDIGIKLLNKISEILSEISILEAPPKREGRQLFILLTPDPIKVDAYIKANKIKDLGDDTAPVDPSLVTEAPTDTDKAEKTQELEPKTPA